MLVMNAPAEQLTSRAPSERPVLGLAGGHRTRVRSYSLDVTKRVAALPSHCSIHRTIENNRFQRTLTGQRQIFQAASPSPTEKKMISARPTMLSIGT